MATTYVPTSGFLALPGEMRNEIYRMLLTTRYNFLLDESSRDPQSLHPVILRVNRQINEEATNVLHGDNIWIIAQINSPQWPDPNSIVPFVSRKDPSCIRYPALHVKLDLPHETTATESTTLIMGVESLPFFLDELRRRSVLRRSGIDDLKAAGLTLRLYSSPFHSQPMLQSICLEPFTTVRGFGRFRVMGEPDPMGNWYRGDMMCRATSPFKDAEVVKDIGKGYLMQGDDAYSLGNCFAAFVYYGMGLVFLRHARKSLLSRTQAQYPSAQRAREEFELKTVRVNIMAHSLRPFLAMGEDRNVIAVGRPSTVYSRFLTKVEQVGVAFCKALSSYRLGDPKEGMSLILSACTLEVTKCDFVQVVLSVCPESLRERMRVDEDYLAWIFKMKDQYDEERCKQKTGDESI